MKDIERAIEIFINNMYEDAEVLSVTYVDSYKSLDELGVVYDAIIKVDGREINLNRIEVTKGRNEENIYNEMQNIKVNGKYFLCSYGMPF